jgi:transposase
LRWLARHDPVRPAPALGTKTWVNRFNRWHKAGVWARLLEAVSKVYDGDIQMIDSSSIRVHQHAANAQKMTIAPIAWVGRGAA